MYRKYLKFDNLQVEKRALEVWGTEQEVERQIELKQEKQKASKLKNFKKKVKGMIIVYGRHKMRLKINVYFRTKNVDQKQFIYQSDKSISSTRI